MILVQAAPGGAEEGPARMAVVLKINPGFDASYPWREIGTAAAGSVLPGPLDYYLAPAEKGGEPPGVWTGRGLAALGLTAGTVIDRAVFEKLFGEHADPRTGKRLGRKPQQFKTEQDIYAELAGAEPQATGARLAELRAQARASVRHAVPFWDITLSVSKSVSLLYGARLAAAERARRAGDQAQARRYDRDAGKVWAAIMEGNAAALEFLQREAGMTRSGYHRGSKAETRAELGKWEHAREWVIGSFRQHTSRAGDPQLHVHNLVLNKVQTERDGRWRKIDSRHLYRFQGAAAAIAAAVTERELTRELGVYWIPRADGNGREIAGITQAQMEAFSSRRQTITEHARQAAAAFQARTGRKPDARQMYRIQKDIAYRTRQAKGHEPLDLAGKVAGWQATARQRDIGDLADMNDAVDQAAQREHARDGAWQHQRDEQQAVVLAAARAIGWEHARRYGRAPGPAEAASIQRWARFVTVNGTRAPDADPARLLDGWEAARRADAAAEQDIQRQTARGQARLQAQQAAARAAQAQERARGYADPAQPGALTAEQAGRLMAEAIALTQARIPAWTKADLMRYVQNAMPRGVTLPQETTLADLAAQAVTAAGQKVVLLSAPQWPVPPPSLLRDGESVFAPHGAEKYATTAQLSLEDQLLTQAQEPAAPRLGPDVAARLLGADRAKLETLLRPEPTTAAALSEITGSGLRMDQAVAAYHLLTSARRAEVMVGPPGTGKTRTAVVMARMWQTAGMGPVVALTTSSNARNVLRKEAQDQGVTLAAYNTAEWLGHTKDGRESRPPVDLAPGTLLELDETSMMSLPDLAAVLRRAAEHQVKVVVIGDPMQMQAVEGGGGMDMLARRIGHVQLSEAWRFTQPWEREATLRLRDGDKTVLAEYRQHDRLHAGRAEQMLDQAARAYLHDRLSGKDTLLMCGTDAMAAELSRRVRDDLIRWGIVSDGPAVTVMNGYQASAGDWIMARENDNDVDAGEEGRKLANRDVLKVVNTDADGSGLRVLVERLTGRDPATGVEQWSAPFKLNRSYLWSNAQLAYAVSFHAAEGRTVDSGIAVISGPEDRQAVNVALTRGRDRNEAYVICGWKLSDSKPGPAADPEVARHDMLARERAGLPIVADSPTSDTGAMTAESVLGACLERDGRQLSATDFREADWSDADRLDVLAPQWTELRNMAAMRRYEAAVRAALTAEDAQRVLEDPAATWLWRTLREAEAAGINGPAVLHRAVTSGRLDDAESIAKVLDWRIRQHTVGLPAVAARPWAELTGGTGDPDADRYWAELGQAMEGRQRRLGEHAAEHTSPWAAALGPVPDHPVDRAEWEHKAGLIAAYRETWGHTHPHDPIGPRPTRHEDPQQHAMWQAAAEALGRQPGDMAEHTDGQLHAWRHAFAREMEWAPEYRGEELALVRGEIRRAAIDADRARRNAQAADAPEARQRLEGLAEVHATWERTVRDLAGRLGQAQAGYDAWEAATAPNRDRAVAADAELRRRHPGIRLEPLRGQTPPLPEPATATAADEPRQPGQAELIPVTDAEVAAASARPREHPAPDPVQVARWRAEQTARADADRQARAEAVARACPVTDAEIAKYGAGRQEPAPRPQPEPDAAGLAPAEAKVDEIHQQVQAISARLDEVAMARARQAQEKAAEVTSATVPSADPDAAPSAAWIDAVQARQREAVRHEPMPRVPAAGAIQAVAEASLSDPEAAD
jgi:hypothetical protein